MEKHELAQLRLANFATLSRRAGGPTRLAEALDRTQGLISNYLHGHKNIGENFARHVETRVGLPRGWMSIPHTEAEIDADDSVALIRDEPAEFPVKGGVIALEQLDVRGSMGEGIPLLERETVIDLIRVPLDYVRSRFPHVTSPKNLKIITGFGDSMKPTFAHGDPLIVDTGVRTMDVDTIYAFAFQNELFIKRIQRMPDRSIKVISDNRALHDPYVLDAKQREEVHVIARVVCAVNMNTIA